MSLLLRRRGIIAASGGAAVAPEFVGAGTVGSGNGGSTGSASIPAGIQAGDVMLMVICSPPVTPTDPSGWDPICNYQNSLNGIVLYSRVYQPGDAVPSIAWSTGPWFVQVCAFRGINTTTPVDELGASSIGALNTTTIGPVTGITTNVDGAPVVVIGHKQDDWATTAPAVLSGDGLTWNRIGDGESTLASDGAFVWEYAMTTTAMTITNKTWTVSVGNSTRSLGMMLSLTPA